MDERITNQGNVFSNRLSHEQSEADKIKPTATINGITREQGARVFCLRRDDEFMARIVGFHDHSAIVEREHTNERYCISFRNLYEPETYQPYKPTPQSEARNEAGRLQTAYLMSPHEKQVWYLNEEARQGEMFLRFDTKKGQNRTRDRKK